MRLRVSDDGTRPGRPTRSRLRTHRHDRAGRAARRHVAAGPRRPGVDRDSRGSTRTRREHPGHRRRRPGTRPDRADDDSQRAARHRGHRGSRERAAGGRARPPATTRRMPVRHPDARPRRDRGHTGLAGPSVDDPIAVVVITTFDLDEYVYAALRAGARGFLLKDAGPALLAQAVHAAANGDALIAPSITARLLEAFAGGGSGHPTGAADRAAHRAGGTDPGGGRTWATNSEIAGELSSRSARSRRTSPPSWPSWVPATGSRSPCGRTSTGA